ncbi:type I toxin-antitoxin system Fst family toxin [Ligilactobacillus cholophilus]
MFPTVVAPLFIGCTTSLFSWWLNKHK